MFGLMPCPDLKSHSGVVALHTNFPLLDNSIRKVSNVDLLVALESHLLLFYLTWLCQTEAGDLDASLGQLIQVDTLQLAPPSMTLLM